MAEPNPPKREVKSRRPSARTAAFGDAGAPGTGERSTPEAAPNTRFARIVTGSGLASTGAVETCIRTLRQARALGIKKTLAEIMIEKGVLTENQARAAAEAASRGGKGGLLGGYQLLEKLGEGGMGAVYRARQVSLDRLVAIKILPEHLAENKEFVDRFEREAKMAAKLDHQNIVRAIDVGVAAGRRYFVMEYVRGRTVGEILDEEGRIPEERALQIVIQAACGLEYAWRNDLIHRDIKPDNIIVKADGVAKLADLGLARELTSSKDARITRAGSAVGTPQYMSPEQATGAELDIRSDIYALGATFYHMVTGHKPFSGRDVMDVISARFRGRLTPVRQMNPEVSVGAADVIATMMATDPRDRYPNPRVLLHDLLLLAGGRRPEFASPSRAARIRALRASKRMKSNTTFCYVKPRRKGLTALLIGLGAAAAVAAATMAVLVARPAGKEVKGEETGPAPDALTSAEELRAARSEASGLIETGRLEEAPAPAESTGEPGVEQHQGLRLHEKLRLEAQEKEKESRHRSLVSEAERELASGDYSTAIALLVQARGIRPTEELDELVTRARRVQFLSRGEDAERKGALAEAIALYKQAAAIEKDPALRARIEELDRQKRLDELLAEADSLRGVERWEKARSRYAEAVRLAREDERESLEERLAECDRELAFLDHLDRAQAAAEAEDWKAALDLAEKALKVRPDDARAVQLRVRAKKAMGPEALIRNSIGMEFVLVPAGEFTMGSREGDADEMPVRRVHLDAYYIGKYEVTNAQFELFSPAHREKRRQFSAGDDMPVIAVTWHEATAFCRWLGRKEGLECRLPTEAEWEKAARGTDGRIYPWGNEPPGEKGDWRCNFAPGRRREEWNRDGFEFASPVGSFPEGASPCGALEMAGNVWEWCLDWYHESSYGAAGNKNPRGPKEGTERVIRGGSFTSGPAALRSANRVAKRPGYYDANIGFRCVRAVRTQEEEASPGSEVGRQ